MPGIATSGVEVAHVSSHGFGLMLGDEELAVPFAEFAWFKQVTIEQRQKVERPTPGHLYWPDLDIELAVESIRNPDACPLVSRATTKAT